MELSEVLDKNKRFFQILYLRNRRLKLELFVENFVKIPLTLDFFSQDNSFVKTFTIQKNCRFVSSKIKQTMKLALQAVLGSCIIF